MRIHIASDHAGFELKEKIKQFLVELGHEVQDHGASEHNETDDYPDFVRPAAEAVAKDTESRGIVLGGSGQGEAMVANRVKGVRAAVFYGQNFVKEEEKELEQEVNFTIMTDKEFRYRKDITDVFLYRVLEGEKLIIIDE